MKQKVTAATGGAPMQGGMMPTGPSVGYMETRTYVLTDDKGHVRKITSEKPLKNVEIEAREVNRMWEAMVTASTPEEKAGAEEELKRFLRKQNTERFDDDGSAWL